MLRRYKVCTRAVAPWNEVTTLKLKSSLIWPDCCRTDRRTDLSVATPRLHDDEVSDIQAHLTPLLNAVIDVDACSRLLRRGLLTDSRTDRQPNSNVSTHTHTDASACETAIQNVVDVSGTLLLADITCTTCKTVPDGQTDCLLSKRRCTVKTSKIFCRVKVSYS